MKGMSDERVWRSFSEITSNCINARNNELAILAVSDMRGSSGLTPEKRAEKARTFKAPETPFVSTCFCDIGSTNCARTTTLRMSPGQCFGWPTAGFGLPNPGPQENQLRKSCFLNVRIAGDQFNGSSFKAISIANRTSEFGVSPVAGPPHH